MDPLIKFALDLAETAGPVAAGIGVVLIILFVGLKWSGVGFTIGSKKALVDETALDAVAKNVEGIGEKIDHMERRVTAVERDVGNRPTRKEMHDLELAITRMEGRFDMMEATVKATGASVTRIEDFLLRISERDRAR